MRTIISFVERRHVKTLFGLAIYHKQSFYDTVLKISEDWDAIPTDKIVSMAASIAPQSGDRICFKFQTNEYIRPKCSFIHKIMNEQEKKDQNYIAKVLEKKTFPTKPMKGAPAAMKFKGKSDLRNNNSKGTNGMHNNMPLTKEHQMVLGAAIGTQHG